VKEQLKLLGLQVRDMTTGFVGIVTCVAFDLYGCIQAVVQPAVSKEGKIEAGRYFDTKRLLVLCEKPVMPVPNFDIVPGGEQHHLPPSRPELR
jgi:hypothetical protein